MKGLPKSIKFAGLFACSLLAMKENSMAQENSAANWVNLDILINQGDLSPISAAYKERDLKMLWHFFGSGANKQYVDGGSASERRKTALIKQQAAQLNQEVENEAAKYLALIPGHAKYLGDQIAALEIDQEHERSRRFFLLGRLGGVESIQQIGRFMFQDYVIYPLSLPVLKNPKTTYNLPGTLSFVGCGNVNQPRQPRSNGQLAHDAMQQAVKILMLPYSGMFSDSPDKKLFNVEDWWRSDASLPYRQQLPGVELPEDVRHPPSAAEVEARRRALYAKLSAISPSAGGEPLPWYVTVLGLFCVGGLTVWLKFHRNTLTPRQAHETTANG